ncbi:MAG: hypothetical protein QXW97_00960 [Candidatus Pacearchaeota archaeon]
MNINELFSTTPALLLSLALYIFFLIGIPYIIAFAFRSIITLTKYKEKRDNIFWIVFLVLLIIWNSLIIILDIIG